ncbi:DNA-binding protein [Edwardsiella piscicida]|uniref:DNA-binding protein n=1 Tax=Edwardsiella piscicida TaxID=1263550 RepID=UPI00370D8AF6
MNKEWYSAKELVGIGGFPSTPQAINQRAKSEGWRRQRRSGVQGKAVEYHISSFPQEVVDELLARDEQAQYLISSSQPEKVWYSILLQISEEERQKVTSLILRIGINEFLRRLGD